MTASDDDLAARRARLDALLAAIAGRVRPASSILSAPPVDADAPRSSGARGPSPTVVLAGLALVGGVLWARRRSGTSAPAESGLLSTFARAAGDAFGRTVGAAVVSGASALLGAARGDAQPASGASRPPGEGHGG